eukprot:CAMPEP_0197515862 /NCGR_PEP_ID=MMETSP1318-20131121/849_1 /TAXON_ID=552666 /ORGANISM="Partenskyella glossopodia, Strain RCC365" /LENGTH=111 /DNA_ID=CAMNT_0043064333 /DNA_START=193 /DNA_END=528 /DNA_ORIENTATION=+
MRMPTQVMARKALTDAKDLRKLNDDQILDEIAESSRELLVLRMAMSNRQEIKTSDFRLHKKKIAQLKTIQRERSIAEGVDRRTYRKGENKAFYGMDLIKRMRKFEQPGDDD